MALARAGLGWRRGVQSEGAQGRVYVVDCVCRVVLYRYVEQRREDAEAASTTIFGDPARPAHPAAAPPASLPTGKDVIELGNDLFQQRLCERDELGFRRIEIFLLQLQYLA